MGVLINVDCQKIVSGPRLEKERYGDLAANIKNLGGKDLTMLFYRTRYEFIGLICSP